MRPAVACTVALLGVAVSFGARADSITQNVNLIEPSWPPPSSAVFFMVGSTNFNQFDPALGTLTGVSFALVGAPALSSVYKGLSDGGTEHMAWGLHGPAGAGLIAFHYQDLPKSRNHGTSWSPQHFAFYADQSANLAAYQGIGSVALWQEFQKGYSDQGLSNLAFRSFISLGGPDCYNGPEGCVAPATLSITYTYTPTAVPEPETYALLLAGLAVVGAVTRRRLSM